MTRPEYLMCPPFVWMEESVVVLAKMLVSMDLP
jgi:hypothetical protein